MVIWSFEGQETRYRSKNLKVDKDILKEAERIGIAPGTKILYHGRKKGDYLTSTPLPPEPTLSSELEEIDMTTFEGLEKAKEVAKKYTKPKATRKPRTKKTKKQ